MFGDAPHIEHATIMFWTIWTFDYELVPMLKPGSESFMFVIQIIRRNIILDCVGVLRNVVRKISIMVR